jgi:hypothetical protein
VSTIQGNLTIQVEELEELERVATSYNAKPEVERQLLLV